jgi:hypothetical protein
MHHSPHSGMEDTVPEHNHQRVSPTHATPHTPPIKQGLSFRAEMCLDLGYIYPTVHTTIMADNIFCPSTTFKVIIGEDAKEHMSQLYSSMSLQKE